MEVKGCSRIRGSRSCAQDRAYSLRTTRIPRISQRCGETDAGYFPRRARIGRGTVFRDTYGNPALTRIRSVLRSREGRSAAYTRRGDEGPPRGRRTLTGREASQEDYRKQIISVEILPANSLSVYGGTLERFAAESSLEIVAASRTPRRVDRIRARLSSAFASGPIVNRGMVFTRELSGSVSFAVSFADKQRKSTRADLLASCSAADFARSLSWV